MNKKRYMLSSGVGFTAVCDNRFKNEFLSVNFLSPLLGNENAISFLLPSVLVRGCSKYPTMQQMNSLLENAYDAEIGTDTYKIANTRVIRFSSAWLRGDLTFDNSSPEDTVLHLLRQIILFPLKDESGLLSSRFTELEKNSLMDFSMSEKNNKRLYAFNSCLKAQLEGDEYAHPKYGTDEEISAITNTELTDYYKKMITTFPVEIYYHGHKDGDVMAERLKSAFFELLQGEKISLNGKKLISEAHDSVNALSENGDCQQTVLVMGFYVEASAEERLQLAMLGEILGLSPVSRLFMNVREKRGLCYYCELTTIRAKQSAFVTAGIERKRHKEAYEAILNEIEDIAAGNVSEYELEIAKSSLINNYLSFFDSPKDHESLVLYSVLGSDYFTAEEYAHKISEITASHVSLIAQRMKLQTVFTLLGD